MIRPLCDCSNWGKTEGESAFAEGTNQQVYGLKK